jgi:hypothetical protein
MSDATDKDVKYYTRVMKRLHALSVGARDQDVSLAAFAGEAAAAVGTLAGYLEVDSKGCPKADPVVTQAAAGAIETFIGLLDKQGLSASAEMVRYSLDHYGVRETFAILNTSLERNAWPHTISYRPRT